MSDSDVLSKAEVGALLTGVEDGVVSTNGGVKAKGEISAFEYKSSSNVSSYCPASLVNVYSRAARLIQKSLYALLRSEVKVVLGGARRHRYDEYVATLGKPSCIYKISEKSLPGTALIVFDAALVYGFVDNYFGGAGAVVQSDDSTERTITPSEIVMSRKMLDLVLDNLTQSWSEVVGLEFSVKGMETEPALVTTAAPPESMLVVKLGMEVAGSTNDCHIVMPLTMLAPVRPMLEASGQGSLLKRDQFQTAMRRSIKDANVMLQGNLCEVQLTLRDLLSLTPGDVLPIDLPPSIELGVDETPVLFGRFGQSRGIHAVCVTGRGSQQHHESKSNEATT
ncbi:MAG: flagellar motor switch protein FliM [Gammaproteobacteria bacterium]